MAKDGTEEPRTAALFNGRDAVGIDIIKADGYSTTEVSERVRKRVADIQKTLPPGVELVDRPRRRPARRPLGAPTCEEALARGRRAHRAGRVPVPQLVALDVITGLALPVSVLASFIAVWAFGFTLDTMSLLGLSLAIGILIDDAIVVRENIVRHVEMGKDHYTASREGTAEIGLAVAATTFSIVVVFVPIAFMGDLAGQWFKPFALTIACSVLVSLFVSFSLDPMLSAYWADPHIAMATALVDLARARQVQRLVRSPGRALQGGHRLGARSPLRDGAAWPSPRLSARWRCRCMGYVGGGFFPDADDSEFLINIETPPGSNLDYTKLKSEEAARLARGAAGGALHLHDHRRPHRVGRRRHRLRAS